MQFAEAPIPYLILFFFILALIIELGLLNILAYYSGTKNFTFNTFNDLFHKTDDLVFPVTMHIAIIISLLIITLTRSYNKTASA